MKHPYFFRVLILLLLTSNHCFSQYNSLINNYKSLSTIAGKGDIDDKGINGWDNLYEGGLAVDAELSRPHMAMADLDGNIYIADKDAHAIRVIDTMGNIHTIAGTNIAGDNGDGIAINKQLNAPNGLWVTPDGLVYILDLNNNKVRKIGEDGLLTTLFTDSSGISIGRGIWVNHNQDSIFYASGTSLKLWTAEKGIKTFAIGFSQLSNIIGDPNGNIVVTDRAANLVYSLSKDGLTKEIIAGNGSSFGGGHGESALNTALYGVRGVWFYSDGSYLLATHEGSRIWYVDTLGIIYLFLDGLKGDSYHSGDGEYFKTVGYKISEARSVTMDYKGNILITENDRGFIRKIEIGKHKANNIKEHSSSPEIRKLYYNPSDNSLYFHFSKRNINHCLISVYNTYGVLINIGKLNYSGKDTYYNFQTNNLNQGIYIYKIVTESNYYTGKILIN